MRKKSIGIVLVFFILASGSVNVFGAGQNKETRNVNAFSELGLSVLADVYISQGNKTEITIEGDANAIEHIETKVSGDKLKIKYDSWKTFGYKRVKIYISSPNWNGIYLSGSGNIRNKTAMESKELDISVSGSGNVSMDQLSVEQFEIRISGSGDINLRSSKKGDSMNIAISGSGDIDATGVPVDKAEVRISGSGRAKLFVESELDASISGSGSVYYKGNAIIDARTSGSGKVKKLK